MTADASDIATLVRAEHLKTGRRIREILNAMRDEGYIECSDQALEECARIAECEIERLRAALKAIADEPLRGPGMGEELQEIARAALEGK